MISSQKDNQTHSSSSRASRVLSTNERNRRLPVLPIFWDELEISSLPSSERRCPICKVKYGTPDKHGDVELPVRLACGMERHEGHVFGKNCLQEVWLCEEDTCPTCKFDLGDEIEEQLDELDG